MQLNKPIFIIILVLSIAIAGFAAGSFAGAYMLADPGSELDPLVAESYLKEAVEEATRELNEQIIALHDQIDLLRGKLEIIEGKVAAPGGTASRAQSAKPATPPATTAPKPEAVNPSPPEPGPEEKTSERVSVQIPEPGKTGVVVPEAGANLRTGPGTEYERVMTLPQGVRMELIAERQGWHEVKLADGTKGWIAGELVQID